MNKTFAEFLDNNPEFWDSYGYPEAVKSIINDWFYYRECCVNSETKFARMFGRKLDILEGQFTAAYEKYLELADIDPEKIEAFERTIERVKNNEISKIIERAIEESVANTRTLNTNTARTGTETTANDTTTTNALQDLRTLATSHTKTGTEEVDTTNTGTQGTSGTANQTTYTSDYPQSSPTLAFNDYVSQGAKTDNTNSTTRTDNLAGTNDTTFNTTDADTGTITDASTGTVTVDNDVTLTHNTSTADTGTIADAGTKSNTNNEEGTETEAGTETETETYTRKGSAVEMFEKYFKLVKSSNIIQKLLDALDVCFVQLYDEDDEETSSSGSSEDIAELERKVNALIVTVEKMERGEQGPYRIFDLYTEMEAAFENGELNPGTTIFVREDDRGSISPYIDDGTGTHGLGHLTFIMPDGVAQQTLTISMGINLERMSPQYNSNLYDYFNQIYELPETLSDIYDHYTLKNVYGDTVYPYYNFDVSAEPYTAVLDFTARTGGRDNSYYVVNDNYELKYLRSI